MTTHPQTGDAQRLAAILALSDCEDAPLAVCEWDPTSQCWLMLLGSPDAARRKIDTTLEAHDARQIRQAQADQMEDVAEQRARDRADWAANDVLPLGRVA